MLKRGDASLGRVWYLLRHLDEMGQGWLYMDDVRESLTNQSSAVRVFGWRRLRQILSEGDGVYWERKGDRIWLVGLGRLCHRLGVERLAGSPTAVPFAHLLGGVQEVRAHFYALTHSTRRRPAPIARTTIRTLNGSAERTQQTYDKVAKCRSEKNFILLRSDSESDFHDFSYRFGTNWQHFTDYDGSQPTRARHLIASRLPNSYQAPDSHQRRSRSRQRKINRQLATDLVNTQAQGNGQRRIDRRYYESVKSAERAIRRRDVGEGVYWRSGVTGGDCAFWASAEEVAKEVADGDTLVKQPPPKRPHGKQKAISAEIAKEG